MPPVNYAPNAIRDLQRLREFLRHQNFRASQCVSKTIMEAIQILGHQPHIGRPIEDIPGEYREWLINFGDSGYIARYRIHADTVTILSLRHQKELDYP